MDLFIRLTGAAGVRAVHSSKGGSPTPPVTVDPAELARLREDLAHYQTELAAARLQLDGSTTQLEAEQAARLEAQQLTERAFMNADAARVLVAELAGQLTQLQSAQHARFERLRQKPVRVSPSQREQLAEATRRLRPLTANQVRRNADEMLRQAGWLVQDLWNYCRILRDDGVTAVEPPRVWWRRSSLGG